MSTGPRTAATIFLGAGQYTTRAAALTGVFGTAPARPLITGSAARCSAARCSGRAVRSVGMQTSRRRSQSWHVSHQRTRSKSRVRSSRCCARDSIRDQWNDAGEHRIQPQRSTARVRDGGSWGANTSVDIPASASIKSPKVRRASPSPSPTTRAASRAPTRRCPSTSTA